MTILHVEHAISDFETWKRAFDSDPVQREQSGVRRYRDSGRTTIPTTSSSTSSSTLPARRSPFKPSSRACGGQGGEPLHSLGSRRLAFSRRSRARSTEGRKREH